MARLPFSLSPMHLPFSLIPFHIFKLSRVSVSLGRAMNEFPPPLPFTTGWRRLNRFQASARRMPGVRMCQGIQCFSNVALQSPAPTPSSSMHPKLTGYIKGTVHISSVICIFLATWIHLSVRRRPPASDAECLIAGLEPSVFHVHEFTDKTDLKLECVICVECKIFLLKGAFLYSSCK